jgi:hypothetical protein
MALRAALDDLVAALREAGIPADLDPQNVTPPGVWVQLESVAHSLLSGGLVIRARLYLVVGDAPAGTVLDHLDLLLGSVLEVVTPNADVDTVTAGVLLPDTPAPFPALQLTVDLPTTPY